MEGRADVIVAGASLGGMALALKAARSGLNVILVEPRTYPGYELSALYRPWLDEKVLAAPPPLLKPWLHKASRRTSGGELALHPDAMKRGLEDVLLKAGIRIIYAAQPVGTIFEGKRLAGIVVADKAGRQALLGRAIVDATEWGLVGRLAGEAFVMRRQLPRRVRVARTLEFTAVNMEAGGIPPGWKMHEGYLGNGHRLLELEMDLELRTPNIQGLMELEIEARNRTFAFVERARKAVPALRKSYYAHASYELKMASPWMLANPLKRRHPNLTILGSSSPIRDEAAALFLLEPLESIKSGESAARETCRAARKSLRPEAGRCLAVCGAPGRGKKGPRVKEPPAPRGKEFVVSAAETVPILANTDCLVAGGGTSGAVAAPVAASGGATTLLIEMHSGLGGTGTLGGVNTYWYGKKNGFTAEVDRRYLKVARRVGATREETDHLARLPDSGLWHVESKMQALLDWSVQSGVDVLFRSCAVGALVEGNRVRGALVATPDGLAAVRSKLAIEATGDGDLALFAGATVDYGALRDRMPMYSSLGPVRTPGHPTNSFATWVDVGDLADYTRFILAGRRRFLGHDHGPYVAPRESRHVKGSYTVTLRDQLTFKTHPDVICLAHDGRDIKGLTCADWGVWGLSCGKITVEIPYRAVVPEKLDGILIAGKAYSATHEGLALARMQSDMQNLGGAMAVAALLALRSGVQPRRLNVATLQRELVKRRHLPKSVLRRARRPELGLKEIVRLVDSLKGDELDYEPESWRNPQPKPEKVALLCATGPRVLPHLLRAHARAKDARRLLLARLLAWYGSRAGFATLAERVRADLAGNKLPPKIAGRKSRHMPPDGAGMAKTCRLIYTLGLTRDPRAIDLLSRAVELLRPKAGDYRDDNNSYFYYVQMICLAAELIGHPRAIPILKRLHAKPGLHGLKTRDFQPDIMQERMGYLETAIGCALARCGSLAGMRILAGYLDDARACLAAHARRELVALAGRDLGPRPADWIRWLGKKRPALKPRPLRERSE